MEKPLQLNLEMPLNGNSHERGAFKVFQDIRDLINAPDIPEDELISAINGIVGSIDNIDLLQRLSGLLNNFATELKTRIKKDPSSIIGSIDKNIDRQIDGISGIILKIGARVSLLEKGKK